MSQPPPVKSGLSEQAFQKQLFERLETMIPDNLKLAAEIADLLGIGMDSAYRRVRGATQIKLTELIAIARHYNLNLDEWLFGDDIERVVFTPSGRRSDDYRLEGYLESVLELAQRLRKDAKDIIIINKEIPPLQLFQFPELLLFSTFFWRKTIFNDPELQHRNFSLKENQDTRARLIYICQEIARQYAYTDSKEIWNDELISGLIKKIRHYHEFEYFATPEDGQRLLAEAEAMIDFFEQMAGEERKMLRGDADFRGGSYEIFHNDLVINDNLISLNVQGRIHTLQFYNSIQYLHTTNQGYGQAVRSWLEGLDRKLVKISGFDRASRQFFSKIRKELDDLKLAIGA